MLGNAARKVMWVGRATVFLIGLAVILAVLFGVAATALGANGKPFLLGRSNTAGAVSKLVKQGPGPALELRVAGPGQPPLRVNSSAKVAGLNADRVDGKGASQIGVNGVQGASASTDFNSVSPKQANATCPAGKQLIGTGYDIDNGSTGNPPDQVTNVVVDQVLPLPPQSVVVRAREDKPFAGNWQVTAFAICATAP